MDDRPGERSEPFCPQPTPRRGREGSPRRTVKVFRQTQQRYWIGAVVRVCKACLCLDTETVDTVDTVAAAVEAVGGEDTVVAGVATVGDTVATVGDTVATVGGEGGARARPSRTTSSSSSIRQQGTKETAKRSSRRFVGSTAGRMARSKTSSVSGTWVRSHCFGTIYKETRTQRPPGPGCA